VAYAARYGHQPVSEIMGMSLRSLTNFQRAISDLVKEEQTPRKT